MALRTPFVVDDDVLVGRLLHRIRKPPLCHAVVILKLEVSLPHGRLYHMKRKR